MRPAPLLDGASHLDELVHRAVELGYGTRALTDHGKPPAPASAYMDWCPC
jgi:DNA polymerase III alpha subunit